MVVIVYVKAGDPYSVRACTLLRMKEVVFETRDVSHYADEMVAVTGCAVAPQIVIHDRAIGDFEALGSLELRGELDRLLSGH